MTDDEIKKVVDEVLTERFGADNYIGADVFSDTDFDGSPVIRVLARWRHQTELKSRALALVHLIRERLLQRGEERFILLTNFYADTPQEIEEDVE